VYLIPKDSTDKLGNLFWSGPKRFPEPINFDPSDPLHVKFVTATANLLASNFGIKQDRDSDMIASKAAKANVEPFKLRATTVELPDGSKKELDEE